MERGATPGHVRLSAGQNVTNKTLVIRTGTLLKLKVQDPAGRIAAGAKFIAGVISNSGHYGRARITAQTAVEVEYTVVVPKGTSGRIFIDTALTVTTLTGQPVEVRKPSLRVSTALESEKTINLSVR